MRRTTELQQTQLSLSLPIANQNSPLAYGLGSFGLESLYKVFAGVYMFYYIDKLGLAIAMAAIINVIYGFWDATDDLLVGFLSDNTRTRWGRRKPWLVAGLPFFVGTLVLVYAVPGPYRQGYALFWYALVIFILFEAAYTIMSVNYAALFPELFRGLRERTRAGSTYQGLSMLGELAGFSIPPFIYANYGFVPMAISFAAVAGIALFLAILRNKEDPNALKAPPEDLKGAFGEILQDRPFLLFTIVITFLLFTTSVYTLATPFWVKYTIGAKPQVTSLIFGIVFIAAILSVSIWGRFVRVQGIKRTWLWSIGVMATSAIILGLASNLFLGAIGAAVAGAGLGGVKVCREMIMANFVDQNLKRTGQRREGMYYSLLRVIGKLSKILESLALLLLGLLFGYISGENPGPQPDNAFRFLISVFPLVFTIIAWVFASRLSFENKQSSPQPG
ncbi:MAG TPA: MFS transporter [Anaerolineales bacterium]|nr:MFS transporter [Anaerolineales bacterium]